MHGFLSGRPFRLPVWVAVTLLFGIAGNGFRLAAADLAALHLLPEGGRLVAFEVALNEVSTRAARADRQRLAVAQFQSAEAVRLHAELLAQTLGQEVELVLYEAGKPRSDATRRVLTRRVTAKLTPGASPAAVAAALGAASHGELSYARGNYVFEAPTAAGALALVEGMRAHPEVVAVEPDFARQSFRLLVPNDTLFTNQWHLLSTGQNGATPGVDINVTNVWDRFRGLGVTIGILDDGLQGSHPDLTNNYNPLLGLDLVDGDADPSPDILVDFHGTAVSGVAAARGNNNLGGAGVAFESALAGVRFVGHPVSIVAIAQALQHSNQVISVYNNSWGFKAPGDNSLGVIPPVILDSIAQGAQTGRGGLGSIFVFAAGNSGAFADNANYSELVNSIYTIAVGALNDQYRRASYGNPGASLTVSAPAGNDATRPQGTTTTDLVGSNGYNPPTPADPLEYTDQDYTARFNGTSSASPVVSGVVALILQSNPNLGWRDVKEILIRSATVNQPGDPDWVTNSAGFHFNHQFGAGLVNAGGAVALATNWVNLGSQLNYVSVQTNLGFAIPDNSTNGVVFTFNVTNSNLRLEHVTLQTDIRHNRVGDLEIFLTSPSGVTSRLAESRSDTSTNITGWTFMTVRNWGELADGNWVVRVNDRVASQGGILDSLRLELLGTFTNANQGPLNPPTITAQPRSRTVTQGSTLNFGVSVATNATLPVSYQWRYNGNDILGAVGPVLVLTNVQASAAGLYSVEIRNPATNLLSADAALFVNASPVVLTPPQSQSVIIGSNVTFSVLASGSGPFTYQWRRDGVPISGAVSSGYTITGAQTNQAGIYDVLVGNPLASVFSAGAVLTVLPPFTLSPQPRSLATNVGSSATLTVGATAIGTFPGPFNFQWTFNGTALPGQTGASLVLTGLQLTNSGSYACVVGSPLGSITSSNAVLTVFTPFTVGTASFQFGGLFQLNATGDDGRTYRLESTTNLVNWVPVVTNSISGGSAIFTDTAAAGQPLRFYRIVLLP